eukprot:CAMPEP_0170218240 /NCGR_PEP_ID=MMETSP0116_2-20130129/8790_1 /TAXON_ID=400756 /ORGANISM="Durinskia baltica, Strain CSIRO CS-38" /LENGTH=281 /DNA_ID=CAMNT_0010468883 /DNA_START=45 /DNA_END=888 /DNA_ORIENTATION=+
MVKLSILASRFLCRKRSSVTPVDESDCLCSVEPTNVAKGQLVASRSVTIRKGMAVKSDPSLPRNLDAPTGYTSDVTDIATDAVTWESDSSWSSSDSQEPPAGAASGAEGAGACWSIRVVPPPQGAAALVLPDASRFDGEWVLRGADPDVMPWLGLSTSEAAMWSTASVTIAISSPAHAAHPCAAACSSETGGSSCATARPAVCRSTAAVASSSSCEIAVLHRPLRAPSHMGCLAIAHVTLRLAALRRAAFADRVDMCLHVGLGARRHACRLDCSSKARSPW